MTEDALFGETGKRTERIEWGTRWPESTMYGLRRKGDIDRAEDERHAQVRAEYPLWGPSGEIFPQVVRRTVVTYTGEWEKP